MSRRHWALALICTATFVLYFGYTLLKYLTYHAPAFDLAFFDNVAEHPWKTTFLHYSFLGQHWEPLLLVGTALDHITPSPIWLLLIQGIALACAPLGAFFLARSWLPSCGGAPLIAAFVTAANPLMVRGAGADFHMEALTPALTLFALACAARGRTVPVLVCCALLLLTKEDATLVVVAIGLIVWRVDHHPRLGAALIGAGVAAFAVLIFVVMPPLRDGYASDLVARYSYLGGTTPGDIARGALTHPMRVVDQLTSTTALRGLAVAFLPLAFLPLLGGVAFLACLLPLVVALLSSDPWQAALHLHYGLETAPLLIAATLLGWRRLDGWLRSAQRHLARRCIGGGLFAVGIVAYIAVSPLPGGIRFDPSQIAGLGRRGDVEAMLRTVPPNAEVSATTGLVSHLSSRRAAVYEFPGGWGVEWVLIDTQETPSDQSISAGYYRSVNDLPSRYTEVAGAGGAMLWRQK